VVPSTAADAYGLLRSAIDDPNPVVFVEHRQLYGTRGPAPSAGHRVAIGVASVVRPGTDATVVAWGRMVFEAIAAAEHLAADGISVEVIDLRTISPLDVEAIAESLHKTTRLAVVHEAHAPFGPGAEIIRAVQERDASWRLAAPPVVIGSPPVPAPYAPSLEADWLPGRDTITKRLRSLVTDG
jgi:2-oxoisovalerate dehydrogenase E1 component